MEIDPSVNERVTLRQEEPHRDQRELEQEEPGGNPAGDGKEEEART